MITPYMPMKYFQRKMSNLFFISFFFFLGYQDDLSLLSISCGFLNCCISVLGMDNSMSYSLKFIFQAQLKNMSFSSTRNLSFFHLIKTI